MLGVQASSHIKNHEGFIQKLDEDTLIHIFQYVPFSSLYSCFLVQKKWSLLQLSVLSYHFFFEEGQFPDKSKYLEALLREITLLCAKKLIPEHLVVYKNKECTEVSLGRTLFNLRLLTNEELMDMISDENFYERKKDGAKDKQELIHYLSRTTAERTDNVEADPSFLKQAICMHDLAAVKLLIDTGVKIDYDKEESEDPSALHYAIEVGSRQIFDFLLEIKANVNAKVACPSGLTPLHNAALKGYGYFVFWLIKNGADVNAKTSKGMTPLKCADGKVDITVTLLKNGASYETIYEKTDTINKAELLISMKNMQGLTV